MLTLDREANLRRGWMTNKKKKEKKRRQKREKKYSLKTKQKKERKKEYSHLTERLIFGKVEQQTKTKTKIKKNTHWKLNGSKKEVKIPTLDWKANLRRGGAKKK